MKQKMESLQSGDEKADEKKEHIAQYRRRNCILYAAGAVCLLQVT